MFDDLEVVRLPGKRRDRADTPRGTSNQRGYNARWQRTRDRTLRSRPICAIDGCNETAVHVHHLDGLGPRGPRGHDPANLQPLCASHHNSITARSRPQRTRPSQQHPGLK